MGRGGAGRGAGGGAQRVGGEKARHGAREQRLRVKVRRGLEDERGEDQDAGDFYVRRRAVLREAQRERLGLGNHPGARDAERDGDDEGREGVEEGGEGEVRARAVRKERARDFDVERERHDREHVLHERGG